MTEKQPLNPIFQQIFDTCFPTLAEQKPEKVTRKIITTHVCPPIPIRCCDWQAYFDGDEPNDDGNMLHGEGATEQEAIDDLLSQVE